MSVRTVSWSMRQSLSWRVTEDVRALAEAGVSLPAEPVSVARARVLLGDVLEQARVEGDTRAEALLVASELVTNAISHGSRPGDSIGVQYKLEADRLSIVVRDAARARRAPVSLTADEHRPAGRGLNIVERLAEWSERIVDGRREVRAELTLR
jgi:anti-sigma regulatory factor (Ser/Thr protein kinase)